VYYIHVIDEEGISIGPGSYRIFSHLLIHQYFLFPFHINLCKVLRHAVQRRQTAKFSQLHGMLW
jgi:hypothetical protein